MRDARPQVETVFVYGSLLPGLSNHAVVARYVRAARPGAVRGALVDVGAYPALVFDRTASSGRVRGLWLMVDRAALRELDALEDFAGPEERNDYDRIWVRAAGRRLDVRLAGDEGVPAARGRLLAGLFE